VRALQGQFIQLQRQPGLAAQRCTLGLHQVGLVAISGGRTLRPLQQLGQTGIDLLQGWLQLDLTLGRSGAPGQCSMHAKATSAQKPQNVGQQDGTGAGMLQGRGAVPAMVGQTQLADMVVRQRHGVFIQALKVRGFGKIGGVQRGRAVRLALQGGHHLAQGPQAGIGMQIAGAGGIGQGPFDFLRHIGQGVTHFQARANHRVQAEASHGQNATGIELFKGAAGRRQHLRQGLGPVQRQHMDQTGLRQLHRLAMLACQLQGKARHGAGALVVVAQGNKCGADDGPEEGHATGLPAFQGKVGGAQAKHRRQHGIGKKSGQGDAVHYRQHHLKVRIGGGIKSIDALVALLVHPRNVALQAERGLVHQLV